MRGNGGVRFNYKVIIYGEYTPEKRAYGNEISNFSVRRIRDLISRRENEV